MIRSAARNTNAQSRTALKTLKNPLFLSAETKGQLLTVRLHNSLTAVTRLANSFVGKTLLRRKVGGQSVLDGVTFSGRLTSRIDVPENLWVLWQCDGREAVSRVRDISTRGLFIEIPKPRSVGALAKLYFFVPEGEIKARAVVRHVAPDSGVGLKFTAAGKADQQKLAALVTRLCGLSQSHS